MKKKTLPIFLCFILLFLTNPCLLFSQNAEVRGKVIDAKTNKPVPNAKITAIYNNCGAWYNAVSDSLGNYSLKPIRSFKYDLFCSRDEYTSQQIKNIRTPDNKYVIVDFYITKAKYRKKSLSVVDTLEYKNIIKRMGKYSALVGKPSVRKLKADIKINWHIRKDSLCYVTNKEFTENLFSVYGNCISGYTTKKIIKLFGKPNQIVPMKDICDSIAYLYVVDPPCPAEYCLTLYLCFDKQQRFHQVTGSVERWH